MYRTGAGTIWKVSKQRCPSPSDFWDRATEDLVRKIAMQREDCSLARQEMRARIRVRVVDLAYATPDPEETPATQ